MSPNFQVHNMSTWKFSSKTEDDMMNELFYNYETSSIYNLKVTNTPVQSLSASPLQPDADADSACQFNSDKKLSHNAYERAIYNLKVTNTPVQSLSASPLQPDADADSACQFNSVKKLSHNAYERDRRKKLNYLYCALGSLLPGSDRNKKLSIPNTVSRVLKYIPELQKSVDKLRRRKEQLFSRVSRKGDDVHVIRNNVVNQVISVTRLDINEVMVHICITSKVIRVPFFEFMKILEQEGLQVINASTFTTQADKTFCTLHLQAKDSVSIMGEGFSEQLTKTLKEQGKLIHI